MGQSAPSQAARRFKPALVLLVPMVLGCPEPTADERLVREILYRSIQDTQGGALARQVAAGDDQAVALAFDLLVVADGALAEDLQQILGSLVTVDAHLFLAEAARRSALVPQPGMLVVALGQAFVDRQAEADAEVARRVAALAAVDDPVLRPLRDACLEALLPPRQILITGEPTGASLPGSSRIVPVTIANHVVVGV
ncbi:MAG: hypothetical protein ABIO70_24855 [Pseudomonadota bacterium]